MPITLASCKVHNLKETTSKKGVGFARECLIFEVCQPQQAKKVLDENMSISTALPCRISIAMGIRLSRATMWNIRQNLIFAFLYNALGIPVTAGVLYPFFGLLLSPVIAGAAMSLSSVSVISNALRLRKVRL